MSTKKFYQLINKLIFIAVLFIVLFSFYLYNRGPSIRLVTYSSELSSIQLSNQETITFHFDRPIKQMDYSESISVSPNVNFTSTTTNQSIVLVLQESLNSDTEYIFTIDPVIEDTSGKTMGSKYTHTITTEDSSFLYLKRNYGLDQDTLTEKEDQIIRGSLDSNEEEVIFSAPTIRSFTANRNYAVVVVSEITYDKIAIVDLKNGENEFLDIDLSGQVKKIEIPEYGNTALLITEPNYQQVSPEYYNTFSNQIQALDINSGEYRLLTDGAGESLYATDFDLSSDGQVAIVRTRDSKFLAVSPFNDSDPVNLGRREQSFGFNDNNSEIIFKDDASIIGYSLTDFNIEDKKLKNTNNIQEISHSTSKIFISLNIFEYDFISNRPDTIYEIKQSDQWNENFTDAWTSSNNSELSLQTFTPSYDNKHLALKLIPDRCEYDSIGLNSQCKDVQVNVYDIANSEIIKELNGFNFIWLP